MIATATDAELLAAVRAGDTASYGELYCRHVAAAQRLARLLVRDPNDAADLVAEALARVLAALRAGNGPQVAFRAYLLTAVRHACYDRARRYRRIELTADLSRYESQRPEPEADDPAVARLERSYAARAFARLPERWQTVLWHTEVEGERPARIAPLLGLTPNAVATLARRARERLRQMYLQEHLTITGAPSCRWTADRLGAYVRRGLSRRERSKVDAHLAICRTCRTLWTELAEVNAGLRGVVGPLVLGGTAMSYLDAARASWPARAAQRLTATAHRVGHLSQRPGEWARRLGRRYGPGSVAAAAGVAAVTAIGMVLFTLTAAIDPTRSGSPPGSGSGPGAGADQPPVAAPPVPVPVPAPAMSRSPVPTPPAPPAARDRSGWLHPPAAAGYAADRPATRPRPALPSPPTPSPPTPSPPTPSLPAPSLPVDEPVPDPGPGLVPPAGMQVEYAATGEYRLAVAGNTWLSCPDRPACLDGGRVDNDVVALVPYLPGPGDPSPPPAGVPTDAASGATLAVPSGAEVIWAGLWWATTAGTGADLVAVHGPGGGWHPVAAEVIRDGAGQPLRQAYAEITDLVRVGGAGPWWLATAADDLPTGTRVSAGWSLTVVYAEVDAPVRDVTVLAGLVPVDTGRSLSVTVGATRRTSVEVGLVAWGGERLRRGGQLRLGGAPLGDPDNVVASRAAGALECGGTPAGDCDWHTFGVDVARYSGTGRLFTLRTHADPAASADLFEVGVIALAVDATR